MRFALGKGIDSSDEVRKYGHKHILLAAGIIAGALVLSAGAYGIMKRSGDTEASSEFAGNIEVKRDACKLFSLDDAKKLLGTKTVASPNNANAVSSKATVSTCSYSSGAEQPEDLVALTVLVRSSNKIQARQAFELAKAPNADEVKDIGDSAYFNPDMSQLNVLKNENWVIIAATKGSGVQVEDKIPEGTARVILDRL